MIVQGVINGAEYCASIAENGDGCNTCVIPNITIHRLDTFNGLCPFDECPAGKGQGFISAIEIRIKE
jgi:hypothetical protein